MGYSIPRKYYSSFGEGVFFLTNWGIWIDKWICGGDIRCEH